MVKFRKKFFLIILIVLILDQLTKFLFSGKSYVLIKGYFSLSYAENTGVGFGLLQGMTWVPILFSLLLIVVLSYYYNKWPDEYDLPLALILSGTIGNFIDRSFNGFVIDFINFSFWPNFNLADMAITIGAIILAIYLIKKK